jgi:hypothetical protein
MTDLGYQMENAEILRIASGDDVDRVTVLRRAIELTSGDRNVAYGSPVENHQHIADIFNAIRGKDLTAADVAFVHVATKLARMKTSPDRVDSFVDATAYIGIAFECLND